MKPMELFQAASLHIVSIWSAGTVMCVATMWSSTSHSRGRHLAAGGLQCNARGKMKAKQPTFAECHHPLLTEWDHQCNAAQGNFPCNTSLQSHKLILWLSPKCPAGQQHTWSARPHHCTGAKVSHCCFCAERSACGSSLQALNPEIAAEWDRKKNSGQPCDFPAGSYHLAWWFNPERLSWQQTIRICTRNVQQKIARCKGL